MTVYRNNEKNAALSAVEFTPVGEGNFSFFYIGDPLQKEQVKKWITGQLGQEIIAETHADGHTVLVTHGAKSQDVVLKTLASRGDHFAIEPHKRKFDPWVARAVLGFSGQSMNLLSSTMGPRHTVNWSTAVFALSNLTANAIALIYGAQKSDDIYRLRFLKEKFNHDLGKHLPAGEALPDVNENRMALHNEKPQELGTSLHKFIERHSVRVGEIALRCVGSLSLIFPAGQWKEGWEHYRQTGSVRAGLGKAKNVKNWVLAAGIGSLSGKIIAWFSKEKDPYNPQPHSWLDTLREKYTFAVGGLIEAASFGLYSAHHFSHEKIYIRGQEHRDYIGGTGSAMFVAAYLIRSSMAKFSEKAVDMDELYAHVSDSLAHMPPDKLPQLMADTAASIKVQFKDKPMDFGTVFTRLMNDAYRYHHIALQNTEKTAETAHCPCPPQPSVEAKKTLIAPRKPLDRVSPATLGHAEKIASESKGQPSLTA